MSEEKKTERIKIEKIANCGGVEVPMTFTVEKEENGKTKSISSFIPSQGVKDYFKAKGITQEAIDAYKAAEEELVNGIRKPIVEVFEEHPTERAFNTRIGKTDMKLKFIPVSINKGGGNNFGRGGDAPKPVPVTEYGKWKVSYKVEYPSLKDTTEDSISYKDRVKAALKG